MDLTSIYILHTRPFRNTSLLVDALSEVYGRISLLAKSARGPKSRYQGQLQLFTPILASWSGKTDLKLLNKMELQNVPFQLNQQALFCGFYLNELMVRVLEKEDPCPALFSLYHQTLNDLESNKNIEAILRLFEKRLLENQGYGLPLLQEAKTGRDIEPDLFYDYHSHHGFALAEHQTERSFLGAHLHAIAAEDFETEPVLLVAKRLMRVALVPLLGDKPLNSRALFS